MLITFTRIFKSAWNNFRRNIWLSIATMSTLILSLCVVSGLLLFGYATDFLVLTLRDKVDISVYFKSEIPEEQIFKIREDFLKRDDVKDVAYVSRAQALENFKERHKKNQLLMESLDELEGNPLQASLNIKAFEASQYSAIADLLEGIRYQDLIDKINYRQNQVVINKVFDISENIKMVGLVLSIILFAMAGLVTFNTIRLAIYSQKEEISVMRLVGASNWFIRGPFIIEGMIAGFFSVLITLAIFFVLALVMAQPVANLFSGLNIFHYYITNFLYNFLILLLVGVGLGAMSSFIAIRRYLKV